MEEDKLDKFIGKTLDLIFSRNFIYLFSITFLGFVLRLVAARNLNVLADDMHFVVHAINFLQAGRLETYDQSSGLWFIITSLFYELFGKNQISSRLSGVIFGSLSTIPMFLLTRELFDKKTAIFASALIAFATFHIKSTMAEMDVTALFFVLSGIFLFIYALKKDKSFVFALSGGMFGLAFYTKVYPIFFVLSLGGYYLYFNTINRTLTLKKAITQGAVFASILFIFAIPMLAHNYLLYQSKGLVDLQFTRTFNIARERTSEFYSFDPIFSESNDWAGLIFGNTKHDSSGNPLIIVPLKYIWQTSPIILILGILGLTMFSKSLKKSNKERDALILTVALIIPALIFLASIILLPKHYLFLEVFLIIPASRVISKTLEKYSLTNIRVYMVLIGLLLIWAIFFLGRPVPGVSSHFYSESYVGGIIGYKDSSIQKNSLLIVDSRFYRGQINWFSQDRTYLESLEFASAMTEASKSSSNQSLVPIDAYYIECVPTDCGWGTVKDQPDFNASVEYVGDLLKNNMARVLEIKTANTQKPYYPILSSKSDNPSVIIYKGTIMMDPRVILYAKNPKNWFLYYIGYPQPSAEFDYLERTTVFQELIYKLARFVSYLSLILAFTAPIVLLYFFVKKDSD